MTNWITICDTCKRPVQGEKARQRPNGEGLAECRTADRSIEAGQ